MLPDTDGLTLCRKMRESAGYIPILMLTAKSSELDRVLGLEMGADDYLTNPLAFRNLLPASKPSSGGWMRCSSPILWIPPGRFYSGATWVIDVDRRLVTIDDHQAELTAREFDLLLFFARHPGRVFSRVQLLDQVWGV